MSDALFDVSGQVVLVSGGSRGIGFAIAKGFAERGAKVVISGRDGAALDRVCEAADVPMEGVACDVSDEAAIKDCAAEVIRRHGRIDTLVNSAGINSRMPVTEFPAEEYDRIMRTNLRGAFLMSQAVGKAMIDQGSGCQINIDSLSTYGPITQVVPYAMSKSGLSSMTRGLALEWGKHGVRVNGLAPGFILTDLTNKLWSDPTMRAWNDAVVPLRRMGEVKDLVGTAIFLASQAAAFLTGQVIRVDGGASAGLNWPIAGDFEVVWNA
jgi:gluconate 5-dehydrogenase